MAERKLKKKVAVIGAGLGGLAAAIRLQVLGFEVHIYEQNEKPGGKAGEINLDGFRFDTGPSLLTMPFVLKDLFEFCNENLEDYLELEKLDLLCKYFFPDLTIINAYSDVEKFAEEINLKTKDSKDVVLKYLNYCKRIYDLSADMFLHKSFTDADTFINFNALKTLVNIKDLDTNRSMHKANSQYFNDEKTIQLFDRYATYNGSNPYEAPATLNIIQHVEYNIGGFISKKGIYSIVESLVKLAQKKGVEFNYNAKVEQILTEGKTVKGLNVNDKRLEYETVISNSDVNNTYVNLLNDNYTKSAKKYSKLEKSSSAMVFYWGVEGVNDQLEVHNILFSEDYKNEFNQLFNDRRVPADPTIYIYISSKFNKTDAPKNCENWFVMINTPYSNGENWEEKVEEVRKILLDKINERLGIELKSKIKTESILTPDKIERKTSSIGGSIYGISSNNKMAAFLRQQNKSKEYKGLYFCGGSSHPGGGIPLVLLSGKISSEQIIKHEN